MACNSTPDDTKLAHSLQILLTDDGSGDTHAQASTPRARPSGERNGIVVFSGGSAANNLVEVFEHVRHVNNFSLSYVMPISDNGGSSSEIIRVFGGPGNVARPGSAEHD